MSARRRRPGQAALELLAAVPLLVLAALVAWQLAAVVGAGMSAEHAARERALGAARGAGAMTTVSAEVEVPGVVPGVRGFTIGARAVVRAP